MLLTAFWPADSIVIASNMPIDEISPSMLPSERRASLSLAGIFALRMLGLFLLLPVFALEARHYPGGDDPALIGLAMGIYGLTQGLLQIPFGMASDRFGRKRVIVGGLLVFALGSFLAAAAPSLEWLLAGRALQGAGAVSAAVTALLADQTRDIVRTKAMALVGASIGLVFSFSLVAAPPLVKAIGLHGLFALTGVMALGAIGVLLWITPVAPALKPVGRGGLLEVLRNRALLRLNLGVFILHAVQLAIWVAIPAMLVQAGLAQAAHWQVYLPAVLGAFIVMGATLFPLERRGYLRAVFISSVALLFAVQLALLWIGSGAPRVWQLAAVLFVFFCGFNILEASQPSLVSKLAPPQLRGAALGVYNTLQSLGFFVGGALGGILLKRAGTQALFAGCALAMLGWLVVCWGMQAPKKAG